MMRRRKCAAAAISMRGILSMAISVMRARPCRTAGAAHPLLSSSPDVNDHRRRLPRSEAPEGHNENNSVTRYKKMQ